MAGSADITGVQHYVLGIGHPKLDTNTERQPLTGYNTFDAAYLPLGWDDGWRKALSNASTRPATAAFAGDSNTQGMWASNMDTSTFVGIIRAALQSKYGNGGSGYKSSVYTNVSTGALAGNTNYLATVAASSLITLAGTWIQNTGVIDGPGANSIVAQTALATASYTVYGDIVNVYFLTGNQTSFGQYEVSIDGGAFSAPASTNTGALGVGVRTFSGLTFGNHSVTVRATDANGTILLFLCGIEGASSKGVVVHNYGRGGFPSLAISNKTGANQAFTSTGGQSFGSSGTNGSYGKGGQWSGGSKKPADLIVLSYGLNDARITTPIITPTILMDNYRGFIEDIREGTSADSTTGNPNASIILMLTPRWSPAAMTDAQRLTWIQYAQNMQSLAQEYNCAYVNTWSIQRNSYNYALAQGWVGNANVAGAAGTDLLHGSDAWHRRVSDSLLSYII